MIAEKLLVSFPGLVTTLATSGGSLVAIVRFRVSSLPVNKFLKVFRMVSVKKKL